MTPDTAALRALADAAEQEAREEAQRIAEYRRRKWFEPRWDWQNVTARSALAEALRDPDTVRALCDAADEVERIDFTIGVERIAQAIDAAWQEARAADRNDGGYLDGYLDGLGHAEGIVRTTLANPTTTEDDA